MEYAPFYIFSVRISTARLRRAPKCQDILEISLEEWKTVGERLRWGRLHSGFTQEEVAEKLGISVKLYRSYESRERERYSVPCLKMLAGLFKIRPELLLDKYHGFLDKGQSEQLKKFRRKYHLTQKELGRRLQVSRNTIQNWEYEKKQINRYHWLTFCRFEENARLFEKNVPFHSSPGDV